MFVAVIAHVLDHDAADDIGGQKICNADVGNVAAGQKAFNNAVIDRDEKVQLCGNAAPAYAPAPRPLFAPPPWR